MKKNVVWYLILAFMLIMLSFVLYVINYLLFHDIENIFYFMMTDIAFVPIEVLFVTLILERLLHQREKQLVLKKLNMMIGVFFSEAGLELIRKLAAFDKNSNIIQDKLLFIETNWNEKDFSHVNKYLNEYMYEVCVNPSDLKELRTFLLAKRDFMLRLLENPNLLEHESFTELLWAVFHFTEELAARDNILSISGHDREHLCVDIQRFYRLLTLEWLSYMRHLQHYYPHLFSFAVRTNPFNPNAKVEV